MSLRNCRPERRSPLPQINRWLTEMQSLQPLDLGSGRNPTSGPDQAVNQSGITGLEGNVGAAELRPLGRGWGSHVLKSLPYLLGTTCPTKLHLLRDGTHGSDAPQNPPAR